MPHAIFHHRCLQHEKGHFDYKKSLRGQTDHGASLGKCLPCSVCRNWYVKVKTYVGIWHFDFGHFWPPEIAKNPYFHFEIFKSSDSSHTFESLRQPYFHPWVRILRPCEGYTQVTSASYTSYKTSIWHTGDLGKLYILLSIKYRCIGKIYMLQNIYIKLRTELKQY